MNWKPIEEYPLVSDKELRTIGNNVDFPLPVLAVDVDGNYWLCDYDYMLGAWVSEEAHKPLINLTHFIYLSGPKD